jgi:hypothetical protein
MMMMMEAVRMMMEAVRTSETSVDNHSTRQYNPEDSSEQVTVRHLQIRSSEIFQRQVFEKARGHVV